MNSIERAAQQATSTEGGLTPLSRMPGAAPVLGTPGAAAVVACLTAVYAAGNMVTDLVGHGDEATSPLDALSNRSSGDLLALRMSGLGQR